MLGESYPEYLNPLLSEVRSMVTVGSRLLERFPRFSLYNSPYAAHEQGCAIDLYPHGGEAQPASDGELRGTKSLGPCGRPEAASSRRGTTREPGDWREAGDGQESRETRAPSPVAGEVVATRTVAAPPKPYAVEHDHLIVIDTSDRLARILHVDPAVEPGDDVAVGDSLGEMVRSGFFAPWVDNHVHLGFRDPDADPFRASGSLPIEIAPEVKIEGVPWDGRGTVVATGETYAVLDAPDHPAPGEQFAGIRADGAGGGGMLDGGLPHYDGGGVFAPDEPNGPVSLLGQQVGLADGRTIAWDPLTVRANGTPITGLSLFFVREALGAKLVCPDAAFEVGEDVTVSIEPDS
jgi:hypothetical protein